MNSKDRSDNEPAAPLMQSAGRRIKAFRDLIAWQRGMVLCEACYRFVESFRQREQQALAAQIPGASSSVPLNISKGFGQGMRPTFLKHLRLARGSLCEISTALELSGRLGVCKRPDPLRDQTEEVLRILRGLTGSLERSEQPPPSPTRRASRRN